MRLKIVLFKSIWLPCACIAHLISQIGICFYLAISLFKTGIDVLLFNNLSLDK